VIAPSRGRTSERRAVLACALAIGLVAAPRLAGAQAAETVTVRGHAQTVHVYGTRGHGRPAIVSSGDGGWIHLGPQVAGFLASHGWFVIGVDARAYLSSFTTGTTTLRPEDVAADYLTLTGFAARGASERPVLIGVSEGAGLSVLAASTPTVKAAIGGVITLGLPELNELGWRWKDALIYLTHGVPREPVFHASAVIGGVAPAPIALLQSTHDEFVPVDEARALVARAGSPSRLWVIDARDHRFSDNAPELERRLLEALAWLETPAI
jgi:fermentation-respiration switch protein FrsA (DUF1100 family)